MDEKDDKRDTDLRCEVEPQITAVRQIVLDKERHLIGQAQLDLLRQTRSLAEVGQILERERQGNWFGEVDLNAVIWLLDIVVRS
jgi:hypothetical protein